MCEEHDHSGPAVPPDEPWRRSDRHRPIRVAPRLDAQAFRLLHGRPALDLALGKVLVELVDRDLLPELDFAKPTDYAFEKLGIKAGSCRAMMNLARGLAERPLLRKAVLSGAVSMGKALAVMPAAVGPHEGAFTVAAMELPLRELRDIVRGMKLVPEDEDAEVFTTIKLVMTPEQQDEVEKAIALAKEMIGPDAPRFKLEEQIALVWLEHHDPSQLPVEDPDPTPEERKAFERWDRERSKRGDSISRQLDVVMEAAEIGEKLEEPIEGANALALEALALRLAMRREQFDEPLGRVLLEISAWDSYRLLGHESFEVYCEERLGVSASTARERVRLERKMRLMPQLRQALVSGRLTYSKALEVARFATRADVADRIAEAERRPGEAVRRQNREEADRRDRKAGKRRIPVPLAVAQTIRKALATVRELFATEGEQIDAGTAWARAARFLVATWEEPLRKQRWRTKTEQAVMLRHDGLCAAPGCTRAAKHAHHIIFRENNGPDDSWNLLALCWCHHRLCIHRGTVTVTGRAGERLIWVYHDAALMPREVWETRGDDEVRRLRAAAAGVAT